MHFIRTTRKIFHTGRHREFIVFWLIMHGQSELSDQIKMSDISKILHISKPAVTQKINRLIQYGYVIRIPDEQDRRTVNIRITETGKQVLKEDMERTYQIFDRIAKRLGEENTKQIIPLFKLFEDSIISESNFTEEYTHG